MKDCETLTSENKISNTLKYFSNIKNDDDPQLILEETSNALKESTNQYGLTMVSEFKAASLFEFDNGILMTEVIPDKYRTFAINLFRRLQQEYNCQTTGEKVLTELATINYVRFLDFNERIESSLATITAQSYRHDTCLSPKDPFYRSNPNRSACQRTALELKLVAILSKSADQANKAYLSALHSLNYFKQPPLKINIKTQNNIVGQNQFVQANSNE